MGDNSDDQNGFKPSKPPKTGKKYSSPRNKHSLKKSTRKHSRKKHSHVKVPERKPEDDDNLLNRYKAEYNSQDSSSLNRFLNLKSNDSPNKQRKRNSKKTNIRSSSTEDSDNDEEDDFFNIKNSTSSSSTEDFDSDQRDDVYSPSSSSKEFDSDNQDGVYKIKNNARPSSEEDDSNAQDNVYYTDDDDDDDDGESNDKGDMDDEMDYFLSEGKIVNPKRNVMMKLTEREKLREFQQALSFLPNVPSDSEAEDSDYQPTYEDLEVTLGQEKSEQGGKKKIDYHYFRPAEEELPMPVVDNLYGDDDDEIDESKYIYYDSDEDRQLFKNPKTYSRLNKKGLTDVSATTDMSKDSFQDEKKPVFQKNGNEQKRERSLKKQPWWKRKKDPRKRKEPEVKITSRGEWDPDFEETARDGKLKVTSRPFGFIRYLCAGSKPCRNGDECKKRMRELLAKDKKNGKMDMKHNFYVGGDAFIYEGKGWKLEYDDNEPFDYTTRRKGLDIVFMGTYYHGTRPPPQMVMAAYNFVNFGIKLKRIRRNFDCTNIQFNTRRPRPQSAPGPGEPDKHDLLK